jgi:hypothetical protein
MERHQRMKNDIATNERRETADHVLSSNRDRNDKLTQERRFKADKIIGKNRARNDETTVNRRKKKDSNSPLGAIVVFLIILMMLAFVALLVFY